MELNQLNHFRTVAKLESVTKAAQELYVSQPNLSTSISRLESGMGVQLFTRSKGRIQLTENGEIFLHHVNRVFQELDTAVEEIRQAQEYREDHINLAASFSRILPALFAHYCVDFGLLPTSQMVLSDRMIEEGLLAHTVDLAIVIDWANGEKIVWEPLVTEPVVAVMKQDNAFARTRSASLYELRQAHFICNELLLNRNLMVAMCQRAGFVPNIVRTSNEQEWFDERTYDFGRNIVLCPIHRLSELTSTRNCDLYFLPLDDYFAQITIGIARSKSHVPSPVMEEFHTYAQGELVRILDDQIAEGERFIREQKQF
jgi:DNA-binding transcriptional LysR family regulator